MAFYQKQTERNFNWLFAGLCALSILAWLINTYPPVQWNIAVFFLLLFITIYALALFTMNHARRSILIALGITGYFILRAIGLREYLYLILLSASLISLELYLRKR